MEIALIYARAANGVIGKEGRMPWHLAQDLAHFRQLTHGAPVIMGRKTWDSLPVRFRPLPGRCNIVITRQPHRPDWQAVGVHAAHDLHHALHIAAQHNPVTVWIIGGAQIYAQALPLAQRVEVTEIGRDFEGDTYAPTLGPEWQPQSSASYGNENGDGSGYSTGDLPYRFVCYTKKVAP